MFSCLFYVFSKCRCFQKRVAPWSGLNQTQSTGYSDNTSDLYALSIPRAQLKPIDTISVRSGSSDFTVREDAERQVITEITRVEFLDGTNGNQLGGTSNSYHSIEDYETDYPHHEIENHEAFVDFRSYPHPDYDQDDRSIGSYTHEHQVYQNGPNGAIEHRSNSRAHQ